MRTTISFKHPLDEALKMRLLSWSQNENEVLWLDSNAYPQKHQQYQAVLAVGCKASMCTDFHNAFDKLQDFQKATQDWIFGYLSYDLKNDLEDLESSNADGAAFPEMYFFQPKKVLILRDNELLFLYPDELIGEVAADRDAIANAQPINWTGKTNDHPIKIRLRTGKDHYIKKVSDLLHHIHRGDIYEANFCQEFYAEGVLLDPLKTYFHLNSISKAPFSTFMKFGPYFAFSASPERYLSRKGQVVISQPIKGTAKRLPNPEADKEMVKALQHNPKELSENIMITDLVRNDLSRFAIPGSVRVEELCKVYSFEQVHQLISTISCKVPQETPSVELLKKTFPMGSMTGAPKLSAMKIIERLEDAKRGLYSGAIGYMDPQGDFDFNVVIRSILYNQQKKYVSFSVGGAITANSDPESEYEECLIKAKAMREVLEQRNL
ncbi:MAG TPA: anthranilate synthase component I family protein [Flavobacteriaceae bacterium]|nr:anthranilate synthase component I family protein [Flavobacteriaceae bacterium]MCB9213555.1 anthranilate synthase component I family protein [Alteromonas sp.]HPF10781.1 anthranilate synthase component I family protein [Flavobacteriaceae bacterium]HQU21010.1 anthranilate synthase component I family protein [Flavobacteriaceae bacterium]HQU65480.1 anthranilate synthase component I family protein [Flavobacteriaceae bacterium]